MVHSVSTYAWVYATTRSGDVFSFRWWFESETATMVWNSCDPEPASSFPGVLHLVAKRGDREALDWLLERGRDVDARWSHWGCMLTPMHLAILANHPEIVRRLVDAGADRTVRDSQFDATPREWAEHFGHAEITALLV